MLISPSRLDQRPSGKPIAALGDGALVTPLTAGILGGHQPQIGHELPRPFEPGEIPEFANDRHLRSRRRSCERLNRQSDSGRPFFSGIILFSLGVIAEYLAMTLSMAMGKPLYLIVSEPDSSRPPRR